MPSSELPRCFAKHLPSAGVRGSLLLGMRKLAMSKEQRAKSMGTLVFIVHCSLFIGCVKVVDSLRLACAQTTLSIHRFLDAVLGLGKTRAFIQLLCPSHTPLFPQPFSAANSSVSSFSPSSTILTI